MKVVLITGSSSGFGMLISKILSTDKKFIVYATMRNLSKKSDLEKEVSSVKGKVNIIELDVNNIESIENAVNMIINQVGRIDVLVNNAGYALGGFFEDLSDEEIRAQMETNFFGVLNVIRHVLPIMHKQKEGKIINISSIAGLISFPGLGAYNSSKWALEGFTESLRQELLSFGIDVYLVEPGSFATKIFHENAVFAKENQTSKYYNITKHFIDTRINKLSKIRKNPVYVAEKIVKIIKTKNRKFRNLVGFDAVLMLIMKRILPYCLFEKIIAFASMRKYKKEG